MCDFPTEVFPHTSAHKVHQISQFTHCIPLCCKSCETHCYPKHWPIIKWTWSLWNIPIPHVDVDQEGRGTDATPMLMKYLEVIIMKWFTHKKVFASFFCISKNFLFLLCYGVLGIQMLEMTPEEQKSQW